MSDSATKQKLRDYRQVFQYAYTCGWLSHAKAMQVFIIPNEVDFLPAWQKLEKEIVSTGRIPGPPEV